MLILNFLFNLLCFFCPCPTAWSVTQTEWEGGISVLRLNNTGRNNEAQHGGVVSAQLPKMTVLVGDFVV
jgi:hypothetical protein